MQAGAVTNCPALLAALLMLMLMLRQELLVVSKSVAAMSPAHSCATGRTLRYNVSCYSLVADVTCLVQEGMMDTSSMAMEAQCSCCCRCCILR